MAAFLDEAELVLLEIWLYCYPHMVQKCAKYANRDGLTNGKLLKRRNSYKIRHNFNVSSTCIFKIFKKHR